MNYFLISSDEINNTLKSKKLQIEKRIRLKFNDIIIPGDVDINTFKRDNQNKESKVLIPSFISDEININDLYEHLLDLGIKEEEIRFIPIESIFSNKSIDAGKFYKFNEVTYLDYLEISISEHCNMNCKGCSHFSNIAPIKFSDFNVVEKDFKRLKQLFPHIFKIRIMGGEPLLNKDICKYIDLIKKVYPYTDLRIVTNGILLNKLDNKLVDKIKQYDIMLDISSYPLMHKNIDSLIDMMKEKGIKIYIEKINEFKPILLSKKVKYPFHELKDCNCINLYNGFLASCPLVFTIKYYNERFNNLYDYNINKINIYDKLSGAEILERLKKPFELCDYCAHYREDLPTFKWENGKSCINKDDWVYKEK